VLFILRVINAVFIFVKGLCLFSYKCSG